MNQLLLPFDPLPKNGGDEQPEIMKTTFSNKRKRVHFEQEMGTQQLKRRILELPGPPSSMMDLTEKSILWLQPSEYEAALSDALSDVAAAKNQAQVQFSSNYVQAVAETYAVCCASDDNTKTSLDVESIAILSLLDSTGRGLESHTLPREMRAERKARKTETVQRVLAIQQELRISGNSKEDTTECLRIVSEYLSTPSRKFARALGEIDGTCVQLLLDFFRKR